jgi:DHA3 family macrolide efflux protein-like MFS transporter
MMPALLTLLLLTGHLTLGAIYAAVAGGAIAGAFRWPAYSAAVSVLVPKEQLGRAGGMVQMTDAAAQLVCPIVAGALVSRVGIEGILLLDAATFVVALVSLAAVRIPRAASSEPPAPSGERALFGEMSFGWSYLRARPGLLGLLVFFAVCNLLDGIAMVLATPMILALASPAELGAALTIGASGMLLGTLVMSAWGGPRRRVAAMLGGEALSGAAIAAAGLARTLPGITAAAFALCFFNAIINVLSQALFQSKVAHDVQGRVFAVRRMIALSSQPLVFLLAGPLADRVFEPLLAPGGALGSSVGRVVGVGPGRGIAFLFVVLGAGIVAVAFGARLAPRLRRVEEELPDAT